MSNDLVDKTAVDDSDADKTPTADATTGSGSAATAEPAGAGQSTVTTDAPSEQAPIDGAPAAKVDAGKTDGTARGRWRPVLAIAALVAVLAAAVTGWLWFSAATDSKLSYAHTRDDVLTQGNREIVSLNTLDYKNVNGGFDRWLADTTGQLNDGIGKGRADDSKRITDAKTVTTASILSSAVTEVDDQAGKAQMMAAVQVTVTPQQGQPAVKRTRFAAELTRTPQGWKLSSLSPVAADS